jgi:hypothetical protein
VEDHREVLNALVRVDPSLLTSAGSPLAPLIGCREMRLFLDFNNKRNCQSRLLYNDRQLGMQHSRL